MPTFPFECANDAQLAAPEQAAHFLAEMHRLAPSATPGEVLSALEAHALDAGRQLLRDSLWHLAEGHFHGAAQVLDVWQGVQGLAEGGRAALGGGEEFREWLGQAKGKWVADGDAGACEARGG